MAGETDRAVGIIALAAYGIATGETVHRALAAADKVCRLGERIPPYEELLRRYEEALATLPEIPGPDLTMPEG